MLCIELKNETYKSRSVGTVETKELNRRLRGVLGSSSHGTGKRTSGLANNSGSVHCCWLKKESLGRTWIEDVREKGRRKSREGEKFWRSVVVGSSLGRGPSWREVQLANHRQS